jgi:hypothetical protein
VRVWLRACSGALEPVDFGGQVKVEHQVWKNVGHFQKNKTEGDELFDRLKACALASRVSSAPLDADVMESVVDHGVLFCRRRSSTHTCNR